MYEIQQSFRVEYRYPVVFTRHVFAPGNDSLGRVLVRHEPGPHKLLPVIDAGVLGANPELPARIEDFAKRNATLVTLVGDPLVVPGGEACKHTPHEVETFHSLVARHALCRKSFALVIGGGAVLDAIGFAAATAHRGIRLVRMPTTTLAQNDAGIGVKNAVNFAGRKNFVGSFAPPYAVVNDFAFLDTLAPRDLRAGLAEAIKVALIKDSGFFEGLHENRRALADGASDALEASIIRCAELHLEHIRTAGDPFEFGSARPLDFGHWAAHKLEELSHGDLRHGEAVAIGVAVDSLYSLRCGLIDSTQCRRILGLLSDLGFELAHPSLADLDIDRALGDFREHLGGELCITLLDGIGRGVEVHRIDLGVMQACVDALARDGAGAC
jgi:3-dehydroquinate synthase